MYAFRKPFAAATFEQHTWAGLQLKSVLVISQLLGYMLSKFIGIKVVSEMKSGRRALAILGLIGLAQLALIGFAFVPIHLKWLMMFLNGLPLGMVFGIVLSYLEGRRQTEALSAVLCASFIISSGVVKSVGQWLMYEHQVSEFAMPMTVGFLFLPALLVAVWFLQKTPVPDASDENLRSVRAAMTRKERNHFLMEYWPGLALLVFVYVLLTVLRTARDDFGVELWRDLGVSQKPAVFAQSETLVAICVTLLNALAICITANLAAIRATLALMCGGFLLVIAAAAGQASESLSAMTFMVACGVGLYVPYVAFHTTIFERLIAASRLPNLGFLMYLADAMGYLGYAAVLIVRSNLDDPESVLPGFRILLLGGSILSIFALLAAGVYFQRVLKPTPDLDQIKLVRFAAVGS